MSRENNQSKKKLGSLFTPRSKVSIFPYLILIFLLAVSFAITSIFYKSAKNKDAMRFANQTARLHYALENKLRLYITILRGGRGFLDASPELNKKVFADYAGSLNFEKDYRGVQGIGYAEIVKPGELESVQNKLRNEGAADYTIFPQGVRDEYAAVFYMEPAGDNTSRALGFDMLSEPVRREAVEKARDTGDITMSGKIVPIQEKEGDNIYGFSIYLPIYKTGATPATVDERRKNIRGFIYCPFRATNFLNEIYRDENKNDIAIKIFDSELEPKNLLSQAAFENPGRYIQLAEDPQIIYDELNVGGRKWIVEFSTLPSFSEQSSVGWTPLILISGLTFSFLIFGMVLWETKASEKIQRTAAELLESQIQKEILFENEKRARKIAEDANTAKDEFIAIISHELKTPLNAIGGWARILRSHELTESMHDLALHKINKNLQLQTSIVEQLLNYSELVSNKISFEEKEVSFSKIFEEACSEIAPLFEEKNIEFVQTKPLGENLILGDEEKLKMVIYNLFSNSLKFTHEGGKIETELSRSQNQIQLTVRDNGRGISKEFLPFVFEQYKQADKPDTRDYGGLGLGLTMTGKIVSLLHGQIQVESEGEGKGSIFTVKFPALKETKETLV